MTFGGASERENSGVLSSETRVGETDADEPFGPRWLERRQRLELLDRLTLPAGVGVTVTSSSRAAASVGSSSTARSSARSASARGRRSRRHRPSR